MTSRMRLFLIICGIVVGVGLALGVLGTVLGGTKGMSEAQDKIPWINLPFSGKTENVTKELNKVSSIHVSADISRVEFIEGDQYKVDVNYDRRDGEPLVELSGEKLTIEAPRQSARWFNFGFNWGYKETSVKVYYPKDATFDDVNIVNDLGDVRVNQLTAKTLSIKLDAGNAVLDNIKADRFTVDLDAGNLEGKNMVTKGVNAKLSAGRIDIAGAFYGVTKAYCDLGDCRITTSVPKENYSISTKVDLGDCKIDGSSTGGQINAGSKNSMDLECDMGNINVDFD